MVEKNTDGGSPPADPAIPGDDAVTPRSAIRRSMMRGVTPQSVSDRLTMYVLRAIFFLVAAGLGIRGAQAFAVSEFAGIATACIVALGLVSVEALFVRSPVRTIAAITSGLFLGLLLSVFFQNVMRIVAQAVAPGIETTQPELFPFISLVTLCVFPYLCTAVLLATKDDFRFIIPYIEFRKQVKTRTPLILDTSVFIDGRFQSLLATDVLDQRLEVPRFVLDELQDLADRRDKSTRERGRRGMDILHDIEQYHWVEVVEYPLEEAEEVDVGLLRLAAAHEGKIVTTDHNLTKRARLQGVPVLNINDLATALKPVLVPGEVLRVTLLRAGDDPGQAVGFLRDGTMVVVEQASDRIAQEVSVEVTSAIQTSAGKMVFGKLRRGKRATEKRGQ